MENFFFNKKQNEHNKVFRWKRETLITGLKCELKRNDFKNKILHTELVTVNVKTDFESRIEKRYKDLNS